MNKLLELKGRFSQESRKAVFGPKRMKTDRTLTSKDVEKMLEDLKNISSFWNQENAPFSGVLITVYHLNIIPKSSRISEIFNGHKSNESIVGIKFNSDENKHIITYYISKEKLENTIIKIEEALNILEENFNGSIDNSIFSNDFLFKDSLINDNRISLKQFKNIIADLSYVESFGIERAYKQPGMSIVTLYRTDKNIKDILSKYGLTNYQLLDDYTVKLYEEDVEKLNEKASYLVAMYSHDEKEFSIGEFNKIIETNQPEIPFPSNEPIIGVIDTLFDDKVYFSKWVEYYDDTNKEIQKQEKDYYHGTAVSSIIVDGPALNDWLDDGCGRFRVRHFGISRARGFSESTFIQKIRWIIKGNTDIKVWNISIGSNEEIDKYFISYIGSELDKIQNEYNVIFVIAGTNNNSSQENLRIGSPADSINSIVVNSVTSNKEPAPYTRKGIVLSFFAKPDVSYYGGSPEKMMNVWTNIGKQQISGTSFAAPWIARKLAYLIEIVGCSREVAKALIIDSARGWESEPTKEFISIFGHGIVPIRIEEIIESKNDEIKFFISGVSEKWNTYNYSLPVPLKDDKFPYKAKATMCYFPKTTRTQGVDYTNTELNLHIGRLKNNKILDIKGDKQNDNKYDNESFYLRENNARSLFRKWDNVKYISEKITKYDKPKNSFDSKKWGIEVKTNNRLNNKDGEGILFGIVVTLKEINGVNRIDQFIRDCHWNGWMVNEIDIKNKIIIRDKSNEEIELK